MTTVSFSALFGQIASSAQLESFLNEVFSSSGIKPSDAEVKTYADAVYFNYYLAGLSLQFVPAEGYRPSSDSVLLYERLLLDSVDVFNTIKNTVPPKGKMYSRYPLLPLTLAAPFEGSQTTSAFELKADTTGKEFVQALGEPTRKGGGSGPSSGSIGIWCEWAKLGIMVEFGGDEARGPQAWERGKDAVWKVVTFFKPKAV